MNGTQEAPAGAPLAAHFEAKRRIMATVKQMEERGEKLEEATPEEILEAASKAAETVFKFDFSISETAEADAEGEGSAKKRNRNRKRRKKRRAKKAGEQADDGEAAEKSEDAASGRPTDAAAKPAQGKQQQQKQQKKQEATTASKGPAAKSASSFLKLRKATGTESEVAKMHLRYGQGRRNLAATRQRELRKKTADDSAAAASGDFKFNFS
ncbi:hypothetical protein PHYSODRAFT_255541 [Phytophthora sojae]|uniref:Uncharacterized protein n=1 Tax=Phytophthora sojae (strain P6497) TaxID=1094619 RepID=G4ZI81_PHYSP|nr:hypothetical protein PHYSODRAFT_255541 [Phytophthora sojae]EGZ18718.1 hypothetical protein PHYSODRAFT_255541 [Phytophthora sojae]|eukprot:XP_009527776.1 hypothetical protein PHYSODRAFT_255541 [Phytophthora sojae]